ncbi:hypothetical protein CFN78_13560 [Amycolatopsis antarctica]|uniref:DUF2637 domain-containing protein n=1 Tax=Amycolatopsis antarctica TaxID=1854586 RepID=A0A263D4X3_9PSEU|nr:hypothetical protein CFN78_13560 [Amycolatopsis antarctica]
MAAGAGAATAHGAFEVAVGAGVPAGLAWIYPLITDGLALVAYLATARLSGSASGYAWFVVVLAAGLSGLAQAAYLAGGVGSSPPVLRFGVGAWPAVAAAIVAHLLFLLATAGRTTTPDEAPKPVASDRPAAPTPEPVRPASVRPAPVRATVVQPGPVQPAPVNTPAVQRPEPGWAVQPTVPSTPAVQPPRPVQPSLALSVSPRQGEAESRPSSPVRDQARAAARRHFAHHGSLPTVTELMDAAEVSRGTAGTALKELREHPAHLHAVHTTTEAKAQS